MGFLNRFFNITPAPESEPAAVPAVEPAPVPSIFVSNDRVEETLCICCERLSEISAKPWAAGWEIQTMFKVKLMAMWRPHVAAGEQVICETWVDKRPEGFSYNSSPDFYYLPHGTTVQGFEAWVIDWVDRMKRTADHLGNDYEMEEIFVRLDGEGEFSSTVMPIRCKRRIGLDAVLGLPPRARSEPEPDHAANASEPAVGAPAPAVAPAVKAPAEEPPVEADASLVRPRKPGGGSAGSPPTR